MTTTETEPPSDTETEQTGQTIDKIASEDTLEPPETDSDVPPTPATPIGRPPGKKTRISRIDKRNQTSDRPPSEIGIPATADFDELPLEEDDAVERRKHRPPLPPGKQLPPVSDRPLPRPPKVQCSPVQFFNFWGSLMPSQQARIMIYVYRNWPVMDWTRGLSPEEIEAIQRKEKRLYTNIAKIAGEEACLGLFDTKDWEASILQRWGSGNYHFKLNDSGWKARGIKPSPVCMMSITGLRDPSHPPWVDLEKLDLFDPANQSYIQALKIRGVRIPGLEGTEGDEDDMGSATVVRELTGSLDRMTDRMIKQAEKSEDKKQPPADISGNAQIKGMEVVAEAGRAAIEMMKDSQKREATASDPIAYMDGVLKIAKELNSHNPAPAAAPAADTSTTLVPLFNGIMEGMRTNFNATIAIMQQSHTETMKMMTDRLASTERMLERLTAPPVAPIPNPAMTIPPGSPIPATDPMKQFSQMADIYEKLATVFGGAPADSGPPWMRAALAAAGMLSTAVQNYSYNMAIARTGQGKPMLPQQPQLGEDGEIIEETEPAPPDNNANTYEPFLRAIEQPLLNALSTGMTGDVFGAQMVATMGEPTYRQMQQLGPAGIQQILQTYQPIWSAVIRKPQQFEQFLVSFCNDQAVSIALQRLRMATAPPAPQQFPPPASPPTSQSGTGPQPIDGPPRRVKVAQQPAQPAQPAQPPAASSSPLPQAVVDATNPPR